MQKLKKGRATRFFKTPISRVHRGGRKYRTPFTHKPVNTHKHTETAAYLCKTDHHINLFCFLLSLFTKRQYNSLCAARFSKTSRRCKTLDSSLNRNLFDKLLASLSLN